MEHVKYFARFYFDGSKDKPDGIVRRRVVDGMIYDEVYTRQGQWSGTDYFALYELGHRDDLHAEITEVEAQAFIERAEGYFAENPGARDVVYVQHRPAVGQPRYEGDGLPEDW